MKLKKPTPNFILFATLLVVLVAFIFIKVIATNVDKKMNAISGGSIQISDHARKLHQSLLIIDLHADSLLWDRDLLNRNTRGHVDVPRLKDGNVAVQAFTIVSSVPKRSGQMKDIDQIGVLSLIERWPPQTWFSLKERVIYQTKKLEQVAERSHGEFTLIKTAEDLEDYLHRRSKVCSLTAGFLGVEGAHCLEGDINNIDVFFDHGIRMMSPSHFFDNNIGGSSHGEKRTGLTDLGKEMIRRMQAKSIIVDLAHASSATIKDTLAISTRPVVVSHTGVKGTHMSERNLSDEEIIAIAKTGGVIGIGYWAEAIGGKNPADIARAMRYTANLVGVEHVALGSDFDGACTAPFDAAHLISVTQALINENFSDQEIRLMMGKNTLRVLQTGLPSGMNTSNISNTSKSVESAN